MNHCFRVILIYFRRKNSGKELIILEFNMSITNVQIKIHFQVFDRTYKCWFTVIFSPQFDSLYTRSTAIKEHQLVSPDPLVVRGTPRLGQTEISSSGVAKNWRQWNCKQVMRLSVLDLITGTVNKNYQVMLLLKTHKSKGSIGHAFVVCIRSEIQNQVSFCSFAHRNSK